MAHMSKLEPPILVAPGSQDGKALAIVIEYLQEDISREFVDGHSLFRRPDLMAGVNEGAIRANVPFR